MPPRPDGGGGETSGRVPCTDILVSKHWSTKESSRPHERHLLRRSGSRTRRHPTSRQAHRDRRDPRRDHVGARHDDRQRRAAVALAGPAAPLDQVQWVVTGYLLAIAAVLPITGWAANRFGARRVYMTSLVLFTLGSLLCGFAWNIESLIFFRVLQGIGGGLVLPVGQIILVKAAGPRALPRLMSMIGVPIILAPVFGPTIGGLLIEHAGWEWIFFVNIPIGILAVALGRRLLPRRRARARRQARRAGPGAHRDRPRRGHLRARRDRHDRHDRVPARARPAHRRHRAGRDVPRPLAAHPRAAAGHPPASPTGRSPRRRSRRSASAPRCSGR